MNIDTTEKQVTNLAKAADQSNDSNDALKFSQAALNIAHAMATLEACRQEKK